MMQQAPGRSIRRPATARPTDIGQLADRIENGEGPMSRVAWLLNVTSQFTSCRLAQSVQ